MQTNSKLSPLPSPDSLELDSKDSLGYNTPDTINSGSITPYTQEDFPDNSSSLTPLSTGTKKIQKISSNASLRNQKNSTDKRKIRKSLWYSYEDAQVLELVSKIGKKWTDIGKIVGGRTGKQVRERYLFTLSPDINKDDWTEEEDLKLMSTQKEIGNKWRQIAEYFPGRTENQVKNRYIRNSKQMASIMSLDSNSRMGTCRSFSIYETFSPIIGLECETEFKQSCANILEMSPLQFQDWPDFSDNTIF